MGVFIDMTIVLDLSLAMCCQNCSPSSLGLQEAIGKLAWWLNRGKHASYPV